MEGGGGGSVFSLGFGCTLKEQAHKEASRWFTHHQFDIAQLEEYHQLHLDDSIIVRPYLINLMQCTGIAHTSQ